MSEICRKEGCTDKAFRNEKTYSAYCDAHTKEWFHDKNGVDRKEELLAAREAGLS